MVGRDRLDAVVLKVTLSPAQALAAGVWEEDAAEDLTGRIWFCERSDASPHRLPLLEAGVILRLRETPHRRDDTVAELCPCRRSRIAGQRPTRIEAEWRGERRVLSAVMAASHREGTVAGALARRDPLHGLFTDAQRAFLDECADCPQNFDALRVLGPVVVRSRPQLTWSTTELAVERWQIPGAKGASLDFVELSRRVDRPGAEIAQLALESALRRRGVDPWEYETGTDTRRVLALLAGRDGLPGRPNPEL
ncbi:hypothetical protein GCM10011579_093900 [Streptomyces albiflavescens]|uniref:Uncharacterized protein n=1 Tax=Streptomyces albiflavescens TaxID=1623582 RepID=A0A918DB16_9ACTN|nr:hypothetical protein [Streptomyces albiflavescens]GGN94435.1 hypothetical protein GCM10011579_093900 [Streptomyces albiflavescens]